MLRNNNVSYGVYCPLSDSALELLIKRNREGAELRACDDLVVFFSVTLSEQAL